MAVFAFLYRPTRSLTALELTERARRIREWALALREVGQVLVVSAFEETACMLTRDGAVDESHESALAGCTLVSVADLPAALDLARGFPGRAFGTEVEIRAVKTFLPPPATHEAAAGCASCGLSNRVSKPDPIAQGSRDSPRCWCPA
jgi:hypothetical protein